MNNIRSVPLQSLQIERLPAWVKNKISVHKNYEIPIIHILIKAREPVQSQVIAQTLEDVYGIETSNGTLWVILHNLCKKGLLRRTSRGFYQIAREG